MASLLVDELAVAKKLVVRAYKASDLGQVLELERRCETGTGSAVSLHADPLGDPLCRVRNFPVFAMLVAEMEGEILGVIRAGVKEIVCGKETVERNQKIGLSLEMPLYAKIGYLLGLRVSPTHRRMRIGMKLVMEMEDWCIEHGAQYVYAATVKDNEASVKLFNEKLRYTPLRTPVILVQPVSVHPRPLPADIKLSKLSLNSATLLYSSVLSTQEFFPKDIDAVLRSKLCAGTWVARFREDEPLGLGSICQEETWRSTGDDECWLLGPGMEKAVKPRSWAMLSVWKCNEIFSLELKGVSLGLRVLAAASRLADWVLPGFGVPSIPNLFAPFGMQFMFGLHSEGPRGAELLSTLCWHAHNVALRNGCSVVMSEVGAQDPLRSVIPHWKALSSNDDLWSVKRLPKSTGKKMVESVSIHNGENWMDKSMICDVKACDLDALTDPKLAPGAQSDEELFDWCNSPASCSLFVDPRDV